MMILIYFIVAVIAWLLFKFIYANVKHKKKIIAQGGIKTIYKGLIDGLLAYRSARIIQNNILFVTIGGTFVDPIFNRVCGKWSVIIQPTFNILNVKYQAYTDLGGGETAKKTWDFPTNMNQEEILAIIKREADKWNEYGIFK